MARNRCNYFSFWAIFCPFTSLTPGKTKIIKKKEMKKTPGDIIILQQCNKNHDHMLYVPEIWHVTDVIIFHFGPFFCPFTPPNSLKNQKILKNEKNHLEISSFYTSA